MGSVNRVPLKKSTINGRAKMLTLMSKGLGILFKRNLVRVFIKNPA
jgi:hypothetical protein